MLIISDTELVINFDNIVTMYKRDNGIYFFSPFDDTIDDALKLGFSNEKQRDLTFTEILDAYFNDSKIYYVKHQ